MEPQSETFCGVWVPQQHSKRVEIATAPFEYALSTRVGCECIVHVIQTLTGIDEEATVVSIDGVGAFDLISRNAMLQALLEINGGDQIMPFVRQFYESTQWWEDEMGEVHEIALGEGGEHGDPFMPLRMKVNGIGRRKKKRDPHPPGPHPSGPHPLSSLNCIVIITPTVLMIIIGIIIKMIILITTII